MLKRPRTPTNNPAIDYQAVDSEHVLKRSRPFGISEDVQHTFPWPLSNFHHLYCSNLWLQMFKFKYIYFHVARINLLNHCFSCCKLLHSSKLLISLLWIWTMNNFTLKIRKNILTKVLRISAMFSIIMYFSYNNMLWMCNIHLIIDGWTSFLSNDIFI